MRLRARCAHGGRGLRMKKGSRVQFVPTDSFWGAPMEWRPPVGAWGTVVKLPPRGNFGGCVRVRWDGGIESDFCGRNCESLRCPE